MSLYQTTIWIALPHWNLHLDTSQCFTISTLSLVCPYVREELFYLQIEEAEQLIDGAPMDKHLKFSFCSFFVENERETFISSNQ